MQDVYRGGADCERFRLRCDRHSVSAGIEGHDPGIGSCGGNAEQCGSAAGFAEGTSEELYAGGPLAHFNEVDECAGVDALITNRCWKALGLDPSTTLHDVRWGEYYKGDGIDAFVWVLQISGAAPANHFVGGYAGASASGNRPCIFRLAADR